MKLRTILPAAVYKKKERKYIDKQTNQEKSMYEVICDQNDETITMRCSEEVFENICNLSECIFTLEYNSEWNSYRIVGLIAIKEKPYLDEPYKLKNVGDCISVFFNIASDEEMATTAVEPVETTADEPVETTAGKKKNK